ncbi:hypothetical protein ABPG75_002562 [Micractinium tetrahymenae]
MTAARCARLHAALLCRLSAAAGLPPARLRQRRARLQPPAAAAEPPAEPEPQPGSAGAGEPAGGATSSGEWPPRAISLPVGLPTAGAVFVAAGVLKLVIMCFPWSEVSIMMFVHGRADLGVWAALKALPIAAALAAAAKVIVDRGLQKRRWVQVGIVAGGVLMLWLSRLVFARPKPSPLDPMFRRMQQERMAAVAEQRRMQQMEAQRRQHMLRQPDEARGRALIEQQQAAARGRSQ